MLPNYHFSPTKHKWTVHLHLLLGIALPAWLKLLWRHARHIDWRTYWHRVVFLTLNSIVTSLIGAVEHLLYGPQIASQLLHESPVFILGHPRTGTTHLHNLLSRDPRFAYCNTFQSGFPSTFLLLERFKRWLYLPPTRPMDAMALHWDLPAEDEIATNALTGGVSPYLSIVFPREEKRAMRAWYTFDGAEEEDAACWTANFLWFMKKVTFRHAQLQQQQQQGASAAGGGGGGAATPPPPKPLLIKSPVHTARVRLLLKLFPRAKFVYVHRHPLEVFQSAANMADTYYGHCYLQTPTDAHTNTFITEQYEVLYDAYVADRALVPKGSLAEVRFEDLDADPVGTMQRIYEQFGWAAGERAAAGGEAGGKSGGRAGKGGGRGGSANGGVRASGGGGGGASFDEVRPLFEAYAATLGDFKKNHLGKLNAADEAAVRARWAASFNEFGYS